MKQKVVIKVSMNCQKCQSKALQIAAGLSGVESVALKGNDKNQIEIIGEGTDAVKLTSLLRKKFGYAVLESVGPAGGGGGGGEKKEVKKEEKKNETKMEMVWPIYYNNYAYPAVAIGDPCYPCYDQICSIM